MASKGLADGRASGAEILTEPVGSSIASEVEAGVRKPLTSERTSKSPSEYSPKTRGSELIFDFVAGASTAAIRLVRTGNLPDWRFIDAICWPNKTRNSVTIVAKSA